jgi:hypothetical protein
MRELEPKRMSRRPLTFKQTDLVRALKAATSAGLKVGRFEIDKNGNIVVIAGDGQQSNSKNEWDAVK